MNKWLALLLIVIAVILDKHIGALISLKKLKSEENIAENNRRTAEDEIRIAELNKIEAEAKQLPQIMKLGEEICHQNIHFFRSK